MVLKSRILMLYLNFLFVYSTPCNLHRNCGQCVRDPFGCKWCSMNYKTECIPSNDSFLSCDDSYIENPQSELKHELDEDFSSTPNKVVQIKPQQYRIKLRPGQTIDFDFSFKAAEDYPADLYFLVDNSKSMRATKTAIADASKKIYKEMQKRTSNVFLGVGTFVDKNAVPYVRSWNKNIEETNSYRNILKLTNHVENFEKCMNEVANGVNYDFQEGGFDALAQVIVCQNETGWRPESRKIVIFFTDAPSHSAGDGKWAGITDPYDGKCYTENGIYTKELEMDYPSISMINHLASEKAITIIFIVKNHTNNKSIYENLKIKGSVTLAYNETGKVLNFNEMQLEQVLTNIYEELSRNLKLKVNMATEAKKYFKLSFDPDCTKESNNADCEDKHRIEKHFKGKMHLMQYYGQDHIDIDVSIGGINEKLRLIVDVINDCDCKTNRSKIVENSKYCSHQGSKVCGICECNEKHYGETCGCTVDEKSVPGHSTCKLTDTDEICSGRGTCICGVCKCFDDFNGEYCQCNKNNCSRNCSGNGVCECGTCYCLNGWTGPMCDCSPGPCPTSNGKECNGRGKCKCGNCQCQPLAPWDIRTLNDGCITDASLSTISIQCDQLKSCALCHIDKNSDCTNVCDSEITVTVVNDLEGFFQVENSSVQEFRRCYNIRVGMACFVQFMYSYKDDEYGIDLIVTTLKDCLQNYYYLGGIFLLTLLFGSIGALIIWKKIQDNRDKRELERFLKMRSEDADADFMNPMYSPPNTVFQNPAFRKRSIFS